MSKFNELVEKIGTDKLLHALVCFVITILVALACHKTGETAWVAAAIGGIAAICVGIVKEVYDFLTGESFDAQDLLADCIGAVAGLVAGGVLI